MARARVPVLDETACSGLIGLLEQIPALKTSEGRDMLLSDLPEALVGRIQRSTARTFDLHYIVKTCNQWPPLDAQTARSYPLKVLVEAALQQATGTAYTAPLQALLDTLPAEVEPGEPPPLDLPGVPTAAQALHQLRAPVSDFVGRAEELEQIVQALHAAGGGAAAISGIRGLGGIGKTELAYAVADQLKAVFPDAQLVLELRGASAAPLPPEQALQTVIRAFHPQAQLPADLPTLQGLYHSVLDGKRVLILADDARDAAQVRPLRPPAGCALLVTSRQRFTLPGMAALDLGTLPPVEAERLLREICPRVGDQAAELARLCGYLPLALRLSATLLADTPSLQGAAYLGQLETARLEALRDPDGDPNDPQASVEASLQLSYAALDAAAQTGLAQLGVFPASFDRTAALAVVALPDADTTVVEAALERLERRSLLDWDAVAERYSLHDLVRAFALARLGADEEAAHLRHAQHYAQVADQARNLYHQGGDNMLAGLRLFDGERANIDVGWGWTQAQAGQVTADTLLLAYADATAHTGDLRYDKRTERIPQLEAALEAARRLGRKDAEGVFLCNLGLAYAELGEPRHAIEYDEQALVIDREIGNRNGEGNTLGNLGNAYYLLGELRRAIEYYEQVLAVTHAIGARRSEGVALGNLGNAYYLLGEPRRAIEYYEQQLEIARAIGDRRSEGTALGNLGVAYQNLGQIPEAIIYYEEHIVIARTIGDRQGEANSSWNLGLQREAQGDWAGAAALMQVRVDYERTIGHPDAERAAAQVAQVRQRAQGGTPSSPAPPLAAKKGKYGQ